MLLGGLKWGNGMAALIEPAGIVALAKSYGTSRDFGQFFERHVDELRHSENPIHVRCGEVLFQAAEGYRSSILIAPAIVALGQTVLGNPAGVALAASNPVAMTCGAIGALYYGWAALTPGEREAALKNVGDMFALGVELLRGLITFAIDTLRGLLSRETLEMLRNYVTESAELVGRSFADVTRKLTDRVSEGASQIATTTIGLAARVGGAVGLARS